jgi:hypothetical protein
MNSLLPSLILVCLLMAVVEKADSSSSESLNQSTLIETLNFRGGSVISVKTNSQPFHFVRTYGEYYNSVYLLLSRFLVPEGSIALCGFVGTGIDHASIALLATNASVLSLEHDASDFELLSVNMRTNEWFNRSLVARISLRSARSHEEDPFIYKTMGEIYELVGYRCPQVVKLNRPFKCSGNCRVTDEHVDALLMSEYVVTRCSPIIYIENNHAYLSSTITSHLANLKGYKLYWHLAWAITPEKALDPADNILKVAMIAVPQSLTTAISDIIIGGHMVGGGLLIPFVEGKYLIEEYDIVVDYNDGTPVISSATECHARVKSSLSASQNCQLVRQIVSDSDSDSAISITGGANNQTPYTAVKINLYPEDILGPFSPSEVKMISEQRVGRLSDGSEVATLADHPIFTANFPTLRFHSSHYPVAKKLCWEWATTQAVSGKNLSAYLTNELSPSASTASEPQVPPTDFARVQDVVDIAGACTDFLSKRWSIMKAAEAHRNRLATRMKQMGRQAVLQGDERRNALVFCGTGSEDQRNAELSFLSPAMSCEARYDGEEAPSRYYDPLSNANFPLSVRYLDDACGEPVWCKHTVELQRRLRAWQYPDLDEPLGTRSTLFASSGPQSRTGRTCKNSKFLIFEPQSGMNGIGSMVQLIASAFRLALCLGRILVLRPKNEEESLTKWKHPGCRGSTFECYFLPFTGCSLTEEQFNNAMVASGGLSAENYPFKDAQFITLKDFPTWTGRCRICGDAWTGDLSFFDGLQFGQRGYFIPRDLSFNPFENLDPETKPLHFFEAFLGSNKETWTSIFIRYVLRPRKWFQEALQQVISQSLVVIDTPLIGKEEATAAIPTTEREEKDQHEVEMDRNINVSVPVAASPKPFLSLHVRYGSKVIETQLQPLSKYMTLVKKKASHIKDIFVSTETERVIHSLAR